MRVSKSLGPGGDGVVFCGDGVPGMGSSEVAALSGRVRSVPYPPHIWPGFEGCWLVRTFGLGMGGRLSGNLFTRQ